MGQSGWLACARLTRERAGDARTSSVFAGVTDDGEALGRSAVPPACSTCPASRGAPCEMPAAIAAALDEATARRRQELLEELAARNGRWFDTEMDKLDRWAEDRRASLKAELEELDEALKEAKKAARLAPNAARRSSNASARREPWKASATKPGAPTTRRAARSTGRRTTLLDEISRRLEQQHRTENRSSPCGGSLCEHERRTDETTEQRHDRRTRKARPSLRTISPKRSGRSSCASSPRSAPRAARSTSSG